MITRPKIFGLLVFVALCQTVTTIDAVAEGEAPLSGSSSQTVLQGGTDASLKATPINTTQRKAAAQPL
ncbi:hypothetical protein KBI23_06345, partial [bacterium]|nr:hypothetical protein [bacterium]